MPALECYHGSWWSLHDDDDNDNVDDAAATDDDNNDYNNNNQSHPIISKHSGLHTQLLTRGGTITYPSPTTLLFNITKTIFLMSCSQKTTCCLKLSFTPKGKCHVIIWVMPPPPMMIITIIIIIISPIQSSRSIPVCTHNCWLEEGPLLIPLQQFYFSTSLKRFF